MKEEEEEEDVVVMVVVVVVVVMLVMMMVSGGCWGLTTAASVFRYVSAWAVEQNKKITNRIPEAEELEKEQGEEGEVD